MKPAHFCMNLDKSLTSPGSAFLPVRGGEEGLGNRKSAITSTFKFFDVPKPFRGEGTQAAGDRRVLGKKGEGYF